MSVLQEHQLRRRDNSCRPDKAEPPSGRNRQKQKALSSDRALRFARKLSHILLYAPSFPSLAALLLRKVLRTQL
ncbi:hypothetical protein B5012_00010 [Salmonella enterica subsp. enterica serovar Dublin]|nr:hypothetical protein B5012_00010 [Salmonella enterica subsp. enterica serovar Dublin]